MECNLYELMKGRGDNPFPESEVQNWCFQLFEAIAYMHQQGYFHRDLKPENLLLNKDVIKIADFGQAREVSSQSPFIEYVSTRWYRAPEVMLRSPSYGSAVDMWAMGVIMVELFTLRPLFPGSCEADQIFKICSVIGSPNQQTWPQGLRLAASLKYRFPQFIDSHVISALIPTASPGAIDLIASLCSWDPNKRPTAAESLKHPFFQSPGLYIQQPHLRLKEPISTHQISANKSKRTYAAKPCWQKLEMPSHMKNSDHPSDAKKHQSLYTTPHRRVAIAMKRHGPNEVQCDKSNGKQACYRFPKNNEGPSPVYENTEGFSRNPNRYASNKQSDQCQAPCSSLNSTLARGNINVDGRRRRSSFLTIM